MSNSSSASVGSSGIGFCGLLTIVFIVLKILGHITWSWWWVLAPLWMPFGIVLAVLAVVLMFMGLAILLKSVVK